MSDVSDGHAAHLPPKPDAITGEPRPPRAPLYGNPDSRGHDQKAGTPKPPEDRGPCLESYVLSNKTAWTAGALAMALFVVVLLVLTGFSWIHVWWMWLLVLLPALAITFTAHGTFYAAGADWLRTREGWVSTYDLIEVEMHLNGTSIDLSLKDSAHRRINTKIVHLQANTDLWDLVYNGIRHSANNGAQINGYARGALRLGDRRGGK